MSKDLFSNMDEKCLPAAPTFINRNSLHNRFYTVRSLVCDSTKRVAKSMAIKPSARSGSRHPVNAHFKNKIVLFHMSFSEAHPIADTEYTQAWLMT